MRVPWLLKLGTLSTGATPSFENKVSFVMGGRLSFQTGEFGFKHRLTLIYRFDLIITCLPRNGYYHTNNRILKKC